MRDTTLAKINFTRGVFDDPAVRWTQAANYIQPQMHPYDRFFYDPEAKAYTVSRFLADLKARYGGIDALLFWPTYSNIGIDDRNQFDFFRTMPGGLAAITKVTAELKAAGVRVLWPYNPWDTGTRREPLSDAKTLAALLKQTGGDGFNGDTMNSIPKEFWDAGKDLGHPLALEPEGGGEDEGLKWTTMGWGYWHWASHVPIVDRFKYITRGKFLTNACDRWAKNKTDNLHFAWFNGDGYESWENVWGVWNGIVPRDAEAIRRVASMLRFFGKGGLLQSPGWIPHTPEVAHADVYASRWPGGAGMHPGIANLWTIVNRAGRNFADTDIQLIVVPKDASTSRFFDCYAGREIHPETVPPPSPPSPPLHGYARFANVNCYAGHGCTDIDDTGVQVADQNACLARCEGDNSCGCVVYQPSTKRTDQPPQCWKRKDCVVGSAERSSDYITYVNVKRTPLPPNPPSPPPGTMRAVQFGMEVEGFGCVVEVEGSPDETLQGFLDSMAVLTRTPLQAYSKTWTYLMQTMVPIGPTPARGTAAPGTTLIPHTDAYHFVVKSIQVEGDDAHGVDVQYQWEPHPQREHNHTLPVGPFYIDTHPVTNARYAQYLNATGYTPVDPMNWLKQWNGSATPPAGTRDRPVTYVSLNEARLFCSWAGGRLPHSYEWQYAAQGTDGRLYPWGNSKSTPGALPAFHTGKSAPGPDAVGKHSPQGDSPFGVADMVGNVWQYTDEFRDEHTRAVILRGGSNYRPTGSDWYFPNQPELDTSNKYFLFDDAYERAATISFRCVYDAQA